jgi:hypothetical protein
MKRTIHSEFGIFFFILILFFSCGKESGNKPDDTPDDNPVTELGEGHPGTVGTAGVSEWDALSVAEKNRIKSWNTLFLHQSVGQDIEEGCKANGFPWQYYGNGDKINNGLMGGIFVDVGNIPNGNPFEKIRVFKEQILNSKDLVKIGVFKFGYADIDDENYPDVQTAYKTMVEEIKVKLPDFRMVHVTPPLVYSVEAYDGNPARMKVGQWMKSTFSQKDVIFDLQALESNDGQCQVAGVWRICTENRNTESDPSEVNGIDTSDGQGHIGKKAGQRISKALLMSIYNSGK